jgi:WD40 repeat protein
VVETATWLEASTLEGHPGGTSYLAFDPSGRFIASTGRDGSVKVWDWAGRKMVNALALGVGDGSRIAFGIDGQTIVVTGADGNLRVFGRKR